MWYKFSYLDSGLYIKKNWLFLYMFNIFIHYLCSYSFLLIRYIKKEVDERESDENKTKWIERCTIGIFYIFVSY